MKLASTFRGLLATATLVGACSGRGEGAALGVTLELSTRRPPSAMPPYRLRDASPGVDLDRPVSVVREGGVDSALEQEGRIVGIGDDGAGWERRTFADLRDGIALRSIGEGGWIGRALSFPRTDCDRRLPMTFPPFTSRAVECPG